MPPEGAVAGRSAPLEARALRLHLEDVLPLTAAVALPLVFLHIRYQPSVAIGPATAYASDFAILLVVLAAAAAGLLYGFERVLAPRLLWLSTAALIALFALSCFFHPLELVRKHLITVAKFGEYALLAPALVLLLRRPIDVRRFLAVFVAWAGAASGWALLQFFGVVNEIGGKRPGQREQSFIGHEFFGSFAGAALVIALVCLALGERRRIAWPAGVIGIVGVVLDGSISVYLGVLLATLAIALLAWRSGGLGLRRALALLAVVALIGAGIDALRGPDVANYLSLVGIQSSSSLSSTGLQTGSQRELLAYIGLRIWEAHPLLGVGFDHSADRYQPFLAAAHRRFPSDPPLAFPSLTHQWGIQDFWLQLLADTGVVGFGLALTAFGAAAGGALRFAARDRFLAFVAVGWLLVCVGTWTAIGIVAGVPLDGLTFLAFGLAVCVRFAGDPGAAAASVEWAERGAV